MLKLVKRKGKIKKKLRAVPMCKGSASQVVRYGAYRKMWISRFIDKTAIILIKRIPEKNRGAL
jgi:hypothetical protein